MSNKSEQFEALARVHHTRACGYLKYSHVVDLPIYRDILRKLAFQTSKDATKCYALARAYRLRGE